MIFKIEKSSNRYLGITQIPKPVQDIIYQEILEILCAFDLKIVDNQIIHSE